eukprot:12938503-Prorocentrum_lima.AAC.1
MKSGMGQDAAASNAAKGSFTIARVEHDVPDPWAHWHSLTPQDTDFGSKTAEYYSWKYTRDAAWRDPPC